MACINWDKYWVAKTGPRVALFTWWQMLGILLSHYLSLYQQNNHLHPNPTHWICTLLWAFINNKGSMATKEISITTLIKLENDTFSWLGAMCFQLNKHHHNQKVNLSIFQVFSLSIILEIKPTSQQKARVNKAIFASWYFDCVIS